MARNPTNPKPARPRVKDAKAYEAAIRKKYLTPLFTNVESRMADVVAANQVWRVMDDIVGALAAKPHNGVPVEAIQQSIDGMNGYHRKKVIDTFRRALGVDIRPLLTEPAINAFMNNKVTENVNLIKTIPSRLQFALRANLLKQLEEHPFDQQMLKRTLRDEFKSSGYNLRRITRDQTNKTIGGLTQVRQTQLGIESYQWITSQDERVRPSHVRNSGQIFEWGKPPSETGAPGDDILCFPGDVEILPAGLKGSVTYRYIGQLIKVILADGVNVSLTPNHPVLTEAGWKRAGDIQEGDKLLKHERTGRVALGAPNPEFGDGNPIAEKLHILLSGTRYRGGPAGRNLDLHGAPARRDEEINVVEADGVLREKLYALGREVFGNIGLEHANNMLARSGFGPRRTGTTGVAAGAVRIAHQFFTLLFGQLAHSQAVGIAAASHWQPQVVQAELYRATLNAQVGGHFENRIASMPAFVDFIEMLTARAGRELGRLWGQVEITQAGKGNLVADTQASRSVLDGLALFPRLAHGSMVGLACFTPVSVARVVSRHVSTPVYSFESDSGLIIANGIVTHNCRCVAAPVVRQRDRERLTGASTHSITHISGPGGSLVSPPVAPIEAPKVPVQFWKDPEWRASRTAREIEQHETSWTNAPDYVLNAVSKRVALSKVEYRGAGGGVYKYRENAIRVSGKKGAEFGTESQQSVWRHEFGHAMDWGTVVEKQRFAPSVVQGRYG